MKWTVILVLISSFCLFPSFFQHDLSQPHDRFTLFIDVCRIVPFQYFTQAIYGPIEIIVLNIFTSESKPNSGSYSSRFQRRSLFCFTRSPSYVGCGQVDQLS